MPVLSKYREPITVIQASPPSNSMTRMLQKLKDRTSDASLQHVRNTFIAGTASATAITIAATQVGIQGTPLVIAVIGAAIAAPIFLVLSGVLELYLHLGKSTYRHINELRTSRAYAAMQWVGGVSLYGSICAITFHLSPWALLAFVLSSGGSLIYLTVAYQNLATWLDQHEGMR